MVDFSKEAIAERRKRNNPHAFKPGDRVTLDAEYENESVVIIVSFTPLQLYATVKGSEDGREWDTMTSRLTPLMP